MGLLNLFQKPEPGLIRLPSGSFTVDREGCILSKTLPSTFPMQVIDQIAGDIIASFREAAAAELPLSSITVDYPTLRITARELRGGAMVFMTPTTQTQPNQL